MNLGIVLAAGLLGGCGPRAAEPVLVIEEPWSYGGTEGVHLATDHFDIYTTVDDVELRDYLPGFLEAVYRQYAELLPPPPEGRSRLTTYLFVNQRQWDRFVREKYPERYDVFSRIQVGAFAVGGTCVAYNIVPRTYTLSVIAHEGLHQYFGSHFDQHIPAWLNEGLACYCEGFDFRRERAVFTPRRNTFRMNSLREALAADTLLPLAQLLGTDAGQVIVQSRTRHTKTYYAQAWALIVFLRHGDYADGFDRMLADVAASRLSGRARAARLITAAPAKTTFGENVFRAYITEDLADFEARFRAFMIDLVGF